MESLRFLNRQAVSFALAIGILFAMIVPALIPAVVSADQLTARSVQLSTSTANASSVSYEVKFTVSAAGAGAYVIDFCDSPAVETACTPVTGFDATSVATSTGSTTVALQTGDSTDKNTVVVTQTVAASGNADVVLTGLHNPTSVTDDTNGFYARIVTYDNATNADAYASNNLGTGARDGGSVPIAITSSIGVSAAVRETLVFCVANQTITANCGDADTTGHEPNLTLGTGGALSSSAIDTGDIYTQITTNAASGAVINLKSNATGCGGLKLFGSSNCNIGPALTPTGATALDTFGKALFGVKTSTAFATASYTDATGTLQPVNASGYNDSTYFMGYESGDTSGVTSPYGDPMLDTAGGPINNQNMKLTFGASISPNTPAGSYSATLNMIATGTY